MRTKLYIKSTLFILLLTAFCGAVSGQNWHTNYDSAIAEAKERGVPVLMNFSGSDWCRNCMVLERTVFSDSSFLHYADTALVLLRIDFPRKGKNKPSDEEMAYRESLAAIWNPHGQFPTLLLISPSGELITVLNSPQGTTQNWVFQLDKLISDS